MKRREFIAGLAGAAAWPASARAEAAKPVLGYLSSQSLSSSANLLTAFREGLKEVGFSDQRDLAIEYRWADGLYDRLPTLAAELVQRHVAVIVASSPPAALAARTATSTIPIVFSGGVDPVSLGIVAGLNRPGGNITGVSHFSVDLEGKRLELLHQLLPSASLIAALVNPAFSNTDSILKELQAAAHALGLKLKVLNVSNDDDLDHAIASIVPSRADALIVASDPFFISRRDRLVTLVGQHAVPAIYQFREFAEAGDLITYGANLSHGYRQVGIYTGRILKGEKPADLPVVRPTQFELVINLKTAKALGLEVTPSLLARADEVIE